MVLVVYGSGMKLALTTGVLFENEISFHDFNNITGLWFGNEISSLDLIVKNCSFSILCYVQVVLQSVAKNRRSASICKPFDLKLEL